jgi:hypothetical protein
MMPLRVFEDFAGDASQVRQRVIEAGFSTKTGPDGAQYSGISQYAVPHWYERIAAVVGAPITPRLSCFRLNLKGELPHSWVHSDDICAQYASVLYLNTPEQCAGGTALWKHRALGMERLLKPEELTARGMEVDAFYRPDEPGMERPHVLGANRLCADEVQPLCDVSNQLFP